MKKLLSRLFLHAHVNGSAKYRSLDSPFISDLDFENNKKITKSKLQEIEDKLLPWMKITDIKIEKANSSKHYKKVKDVPLFRVYDFVKIDLMLFFKKKDKYYFMESTCIFLNYQQPSLKDSIKKTIEEEDYVKTFKRYISLLKQDGNPDVSKAKAYFRRVAPDYSLANQLENVVTVKEMNLFPEKDIKLVIESLGIDPYQYNVKKLRGLAQFIRNKISEKLKIYLMKNKILLS